MENYYQLKKEADALRKSKKYSEAAEYYERILQDYPDKCNKWDKWGYAFCLYKLKKYQESLDICEQYYLEDSEFEYMNHIYAWNLFHLKINNQETNDIKRFLNEAEFVLNLIGSKTDFSPYNMVIFEVLDKLNDYGMKYLKIMDKWLQKLDLEKLSNKPYSFTDERGKHRELASDLEKYFMYKIQVTYFKKKYNECIDTCRQAFDRIDNLHYNNQIWFQRRMAQSYAKIGEYDKAIEKFKDILKHKKDWFLLGELGEIYFNKNDFENAKKYLLQAVLSPGILDKKVNLLKLVANLYSKEGNNDFAETLLDLCYRIREKNKWQIPDYLKGRNPQFDYPTLKNHIQTFIHNEYEQLEPYNLGTVTKIFPHGKAGFIRGDNGESYYFLLRDVQGNKNISENDKVKFRLTEGFDKKKNKKTINATDIALV